jgi:hypothetical protein
MFMHIHTYIHTYQGWGGLPVDPQEYYELDISSIHKMFSVFGILGTPQDVEDATALVDEAGLSLLCHEFGYVNDLDRPTIRLEWEHFTVVCALRHFVLTCVGGWVYALFDWKRLYCMA